MKRGIAFVAAVVAGLGFSGPVAGANLDKLKVLYIGDQDGARAKQFVGFLRENVLQVDVASRRTFKPAEAAEVDVVLVDWPQSQDAREERWGPGPLGNRATWNKPTVLLGSAGLNLAVAWKLRGGSG